MTGTEQNTLAMLTQLSRSVYRRISDSGATPNVKHFVVLSHLRELGPVPQKYLGELLCIDPNNTVLMLNEMEAAGLVIRQRDPSDRRRHLVELTEEGRMSLEQSQRGMVEIEDEVLAALTPEQRAQFHDLLHVALHGEHGVISRACSDALVSDAPPLVD
ncbi:MAG TPA: MarR family transcriptional regulator [Solirubrobacteraceae bacterium]|jgi:DNA-binding MarR family transcriptional regulator|nr:MarR family transcriptional regulator [Solirubrobacteraceae bacterium]